MDITGTSGAMRQFGVSGGARGWSDSHGGQRDHWFGCDTSRSVKLEPIYDMY